MVFTQPDRGWSWMVLFAACWVMIIEGGFMASLGIVHLALLDRFEDSNMKTSIAGSLLAGINAAGGLLASALIERFSCRVVTMVGSLVFTVGIVVCALPVSLDVFILAYGILAGIGSSLPNVTAFIAVGFNFRRRMNLANGILATANAFGALVMPPLVEILRQHYGHQMLFLILGCISVQQTVMGAMYFPSYLENTQKGYPDMNNRNKPRVCSPVCQKITTLLTNISFLCFIGYLCLTQLGTFVIFLHLPKFATTLGYTAMQGSLLLTVKGTCSLFGRLLFSIMANSESNNTDLTVLLFGISTFMSFAGILLPFYGASFVGLVTFCVFGGFYCEAVYGILNTLTLELVGLEHFALATGIEFASLGLGIFAGPTLVGQILDVGGTYTLCFCMTGVIMLIGSLLILVAGLFKPARQTRGILHKDMSMECMATEKQYKDEDATSPLTELTGVETAHGTDETVTDD